MKILIHPESTIHSIIENLNFTSTLNSFYPDMFIPIFNFFNNNNNVDHGKKFTKVIKFNFEKVKSLNFYEVDDSNNFRYIKYLKN